MKMARTRKRAIVANNEMKQGKSKKRSRIDGPLSERNESDHDEIVIRSNRRQRSTRFVRESNSSNPTPSTSALDAVPSSSSGVVTENKVLIKIEDDSEQMDSDVLESDDHEGFESNDMRMNVAPALTCSGYNHSNRSGMKDASVQTYPTYEVEKADNAKIKSHLKEKLECPVCSQIALPPIMQCRNGHITCNKCRLKVRDCPVCRETDTDIRNLYAEKSIHFLSIPCDYKQYGCKEEIQFSDKEMHENQCKYRPFNCPYIECEDKLAADDVVSHVTSKHVDEFKNSDGPEITASMILTGAYFGGDGAWSPRMISCFGRTFFDVALTRDRSLHHWVWILGEEEVAQEFVYEITAFKGNIKYMYGGEVSSLRIPDDDIVTHGKCLSINDQVGRHLRDENKIRYKLKLMKV